MISDKLIVRHHLSAHLKTWKSICNRGFFVFWCYSITAKCQYHTDPCRLWSMFCHQLDFKSSFTRTNLIESLILRFQWFLYAIKFPENNLLLIILSFIIVFTVGYVGQWQSTCTGSNYRSGNRCHIEGSREKKWWSLFQKMFMLWSK